eukprot:GGOE01036450.1.p1 GENE.GGOE01036450.1~~GGOE01036450.1.p1  ORF type:complete len:560 (+),score=165.69 GGOE01036450.1:33-1682(+)
MSEKYCAERGVDGLLAELRQEVAERQPENMLCFLMQRLSARLNPTAESPPPQKTIHPLERSPHELDLRALTIVVFGASGDLAWKKTYPALFELWCIGLLPRHAHFVGFARSHMERGKFLDRISARFKGASDNRTAFLERCFYLSGEYDAAAPFQQLAAQMAMLESLSPGQGANRCFYLALPPSVFTAVGKNVRKHCMSGNGWNRIIVEKPFGRDLPSAQQMAQDLAVHFTEEQIYRIDHYLGKEMVQNVISLRFANKVLSSVWSNDHIANVQITFKEPFGTEGRGGYFDQFGVIRDVIQNHLLQVMTLVAMERPKSLNADAIRDEKVHVLRSLRAINPKDVVLGQYLRAPNGEGEAYLEDPTVPAGSRTATFATVVLFVDNDRWVGVPWILKAGKATNERKAEIRIQFKKEILPFKDRAAHNELVIRLQPAEAIYLKLMVKQPGLHPLENLTQTELDLMYQNRYDDLQLPDAYSGLIFDCLCGNQGNFVRTDELLEAWRVFTPLLENIEGSGVAPIPYVFGTRGPKESDELIYRYGYHHEEGYIWRPAK